MVAQTWRESAASDGNRSTGCPAIPKRTDGVHEAAVHVCVEQVGHGQDSAVAQGSQAAGHSSLAPTYNLAFVLNLAAVVQQVHEEREVPGEVSSQLKIRGKIR